MLPAEVAEKLQREAFKALVAPRPVKRNGINNNDLPIYTKIWFSDMDKHFADAVNIGKIGDAFLGIVRMKSWQLGIRTNVKNAAQIQIKTTPEIGGSIPR